MIEIVSRNNKGEITQIKRYLRDDHLTHTMYKLCMEEMQVDLQYYYRNDAVFITSEVYNISGETKKKVAVLLVRRFDIFDSSIYAYYAGSINTVELDLVRSYYEK